MPGYTYTLEKIAVGAGFSDSVISLNSLYGKLYACTHNFSGVGGRLLEWSGSNDWLVKADTNEADTWLVATAVIDGSLYASGLNCLLRWNGSDAWVKLAGKLTTAYTHDSIIHHNGVIYTASGNLNGGRLFKYDNGDLVIKAARAYDQSISCTISFNNKLYAGTTGGTLFQWNGSNAWIEVAFAIPTTSNIESLVEFNGKLYASSNNKILEWDGYENWIVVGNIDGVIIKSLTIFRGSLYGVGEDKLLKCSPGGECTIVSSSNDGNELVGLAINDNELYSVNDVGDLYKVKIEIVESSMFLLHRGTKEQNDSYTGMDGELTIDFTNMVLRLHDNVAIGGYEILSANQIESLISLLEPSLDIVDNSLINNENYITALTTISLPNKLNTSLLNSNNGVATLDESGNIPLSQIDIDVVGHLTYEGLWDASTNTPALPAVPINNGEYWVTSIAGSYLGIDFEPGDWIIINGDAWGKIDNTQSVTSVSGKSGIVVIVKSDVGLDLVDNTSDADKGINAELQIQLNLKAGINDVTFTGEVTAPTPDIGDISTTIATTEFVKTIIEGVVNDAGVKTLTSDGSIDVGGSVSNPVLSILEASVLADGSMSVVDKIKLGDIESNAQVNLSTNLSTEINGNEIKLISSTGDDVILLLATEANSGLLSKEDHLKLMNLSSDAGVNEPTNLTAAVSGNSVIILNTTGINVTLPIADGLTAGLTSIENKVKLDSIESGAQVNTISTVSGKVGDVVLDKDDVSLNLVENYGTANEVEAIEGISNTLMMTPAGNRSFIESVGIKPGIFPEQWLIDSGIVK